MTSKRRRKEKTTRNAPRVDQTSSKTTERPRQPQANPPTSPESSPSRLRRDSWFLVDLLNQPVATATATAITLAGFILSLAPFIGSSTALALIGIPMMIWGTVRFTLRVRSRAFRITGSALIAVGGLSLVLVAARPVIEPDPVRFFYDGSPLVSAEGTALEGTSFPPLTADPEEGREVDQVFDPGELTVSCWVHGRFNGDDLDWASIVDGQYTTLWVPLASLGAMGRGTVRTVLPCSDWRWRLSRIP